MGCLNRCSLVVLPLAFGALSVHAETLNYANWDTRLQGHFDAVANSADGNGSLQLSVDPPAGTGQDKVAVIFYSPNGPLGTLNDLSHLTLDAFKSSSPSTLAAADFAYRLQFANGDSLVYENSYNGSAAVPLDQWRSLNLIGGNFWLYEKATNTNFNGGSDAHPLSFYSSSEGSNSIVGLQIGYGSGIGAFSGNVDNIHLDFAGGASFDGPVTTPLPSSALGGMACFGLLAGGIFVRRRKFVA
jgi:hypothetical protein